MADNNVLTVDQINGRPSVFVYEALSGTIFHVTPINLPTLRAIQLKAQDLYPYPDPKPYQIEDPSEVAFTPGQVSRAEDNPDYVTACKVVDLERAKWADRAIFDYAVTCPKYPTQDAMVQAFKPQLDKLRKIAKFEDTDSEYDIVLLHLVLTGNEGGLSDYVRIIRLAIQAVALAPAEVAQGIRFFRSKV